MPTIAGANSSPYKQIVAARSERNGGVLAVGSIGDEITRKRKLRSDSAAAAAANVRGCPISKPMKCKSPRRCAASSPSTPEKDDSGEKLETPVKPAVKKLSDCFDAKPNWNPQDEEQMKAVKEALHVSKAPSTIVCREDEQKRVFEFVKGCVENQKAGSLYICGCPGTGKSLSMEKVKQQVDDWAKEAGLLPLDTVSVNCTSLTNTTEIFKKIHCKDQPKKKVNGSSSLHHLQNLYSQKQQPSGSKMMLIIADEMDYLIMKDRGALHDLFMLTTLPYSRCILIGVANAIDLADRFLPRLKSLNCKPVVITFRAYSKDQILRILKERLMALPYVVFQSQALELCARKVAAASGDMRKALCVCRSALETLEAEFRESIDTSSQGPNPEDPIVRIDRMASALAKTFRSPVVDTIQSLPQHQQIIICSAVKTFRGSKKDTTIGELNKSYLQFCKSLMIPPAGIMEFTNMCRVLNDQGLLKLGQAREDKLKRVTLVVDESDVTFALQGIRFFRNCLQ